MTVSSQVEVKRPLPTLYEDDEEGELGESNPHVIADVILFICLKAHLAHRTEYSVYSNMNLYYEPDSPGISRLPYVSPDIMVVAPYHPLPDDLPSYQIGREGPAPLLTGEILSARSAQQRDLAEKVILYSSLGVAEYLLVDALGLFLPGRLLLKRLQPDGTWRDVQDPDGGITSDLGFRVVMDNDGQLLVLDAATGKPYLRPEEAQGAFEAEVIARKKAESARQQESIARQHAEQAIQQAEAARQQAEMARQQAEMARQQAEARLRELETELGRRQPPEK